MSTQERDTAVWILRCQRDGMADMDRSCQCVGWTSTFHAAYAGHSKFLNGTS